jgi:MoaA/NifB/PqqE/SkfB family radical SAM enzyme
VRVAVVFGPLRVSRDFVDYPYLADLGAVQAASVLAGAGIEVDLVDAFALDGAGLTEDRDAGYLRLGAPPDAIAARMAERAPPDAIVCAYTPFHRPPARDPALAELLALVAPRAPILLADLYQSGQHYVDAPAAAVRAAYPEAAGYAKYEAEASLPSLVAAIAARRPIDPGDGAPADLDALPLPAWHLVDAEARFAFHDRVAHALGRPRFAFPFAGAARGRARRALPLVTSRGCPYRCAHCSSNPGLAPGRPKIQRRYSLAYLERALAALAARGANCVQILDELTNVDEAHFDGLLALLDRLDLDYEIPNGLRADYLEPRHLDALARRVTTVSVSAESGVQRVVDEVVGKRLDLAAIDRAALNAKAAGVPLLVHFIVGMPGETRAEINATLDYAARLAEEHGVEPAVQFATPLPGTRLAAEAVARGLPIAADDYGPRFQARPTITAARPGEPQPTEAEMVAFRAAFDERLRASATPEKLILNVTYRCNNKCTFCAVGTRDQYDGDTTRQREHLAKWRARGVDLVDFDGGEPTLHDGLCALCGYARAIGYRRINVTSNGRRMAYPEFARALVGSGLTSLLISIHGPDRATHAKEVCVLEAFDQTVSGLKNACAARDSLGIPVEIGVNITLTEGNYRTLAGVAELALDAGAPWLNVQFLTPFGRATLRTAPDTADAARVTREVIDRYGERMRIQVINLPKCFLPGYEKYVQGDVAKLSRRMVFVNNEDVNLARYLAERRVKREVCGPCVHASACGGFYELGDAPEPPWKIAPEDLVREIRLPQLRPRE